MTVPHVPAGFSTVNPFIVCRDIQGVMGFVTEVFGGVEHPDARTVDDDGLLLHAELQVGGSTIMFAERKPGWPFTPALLQVYVDDVARSSGRAERMGAEVVTRPTSFFGEVLCRLLDPWHNLWWISSSPPPGESAASEDDAGAGDEGGWDGADGAGGAGGDWQPTPELIYIHDTLVDTFPRLRDPHR